MLLQKKMSKSIVNTVTANGLAQLTHWGQVIYIYVCMCVSKLDKLFVHIIVYGLFDNKPLPESMLMCWRHKSQSTFIQAPVKYQAITWSHDYLLSIRPLATHFTKKWTFKFKKFSFEEMYWKMLSANFQPFWSYIWLPQHRLFMNNVINVWYNHCVDLSMVFKLQSNMFCQIYR